MELESLMEQNKLTRSLQIQMKLFLSKEKKGLRNNIATVVKSMLGDPKVIYNIFLFFK